MTSRLEAVVGAGWSGIIVPDCVVMALGIGLDVEVLQIRLGSGLEIIMLVHHGAVRVAVGCRSKN